MSHVDRMKAERAELADRLEKLAAFINENPTFDTLDYADKALLIIQRDAMRTYEKVLTARIGRAEPFTGDDCGPSLLDAQGAE